MPGKFSPVEVKIIKLICQQLTAKEIADKLGFSFRTVESYKLAIQKKIKARNIVGIALYAVREGIVRIGIKHAT
jgi:DNA-binding CsgD family transcriptional regulator